jgi:hypothetical protein
VLILVIKRKTCLRKKRTRAGRDLLLLNNEYIFAYYDAQHVSLGLQIYLFGATCDKNATHFLTKKVYGYGAEKNNISADVLVIISNSSPLLNGHGPNSTNAFSLFHSFHLCVKNSIIVRKIII